MSGSDSPSSDTKVVRFFWKTNKITTNYQNLELSDPWRLYKACCPKRNFDFWRKLLKALNTPIYIGSFRAGSECSRVIRAYALFTLLCPVSGLPGVQAPSGSWWSERGNGIPCGARTPCSTGSTRAGTTRGQDRTRQDTTTGNHRQPPATTDTTTRDPKVI